MKHSVE